MKNNKALMIIDVQVGMFDPNDPVYRGEELLENIRQLIDKARSTDTTVIYVQHNEGVGEQLESGTPDWTLHPSIRPNEGDVVIQKFTPDSFYKTNLQEELEKHSIQEIVICGLQTEVCIDTTCRRAFSSGYKVTLVRDAHSTYDSKNLSAEQMVEHHNHVLRLFAELKESKEVLF